MGEAYSGAAICHRRRKMGTNMWEGPTAQFVTPPLKTSSYLKRKSKKVLNY
jgi:hypothetical protein